MSIFDWKPEYSLGHGEIDAQHHRLFELGAELNAAMAHGKGREALSKILADLIGYTRQHFAHEERLMQAHRYPDYASHKADHDALTARVVEFHENFEDGRVAMTVDLMQFIKDWLMHHIGETDRKVAEFLKAKAA